MFDHSRRTPIPKTRGSMKWQNGLPHLNAWIPNISHSFLVFPTTNTFNPYRSEYGHALSEQTRLGIYRINAQLLYNPRLASGSSTYTGSQPSQNQREIENRHLYSSQTHQNLSGRQGLLIPDQNLYDIFWISTTSESMIA